MSVLRIITTEDFYKPVDEIMIYELEELFDRKVIFPWNDNYNEERAIWNGQIDKRPACIVKCENQADVVNAIKFANENGIKVSIRSTGHQVAGSSLIDDGLVIDLTEMKAIEVDAENKIATAQPGVTWGELDQATQEYGLATPGGVVSDTGIAGLTLGGGYGWLRREYGLASDNLLSVTIVTGDGRIVEASEKKNSDLFWAVRGGSGNFGVVTKFTYQLHDIGTELYMGVSFFKADNATTIVKDYLGLCDGTSEKITSMLLLGWVPDEDVFPKEHHGEPTVIMLAVYTGDPEEGEKKLVDFRNLGEILVDFSDVMPYTEIQTFFDADYPEGMQYYWSSLYFDSLDEDAIELLVEKAFQSPSHLTTVDIWHLGGKIKEYSDQGAIPFRHANYLLGIESNWEDSAESDSNVSWNQKIRDMLSDHFLDGGYVNFSSGEDGQSSSQSHYHTLLQKLSEIKTIYDPNEIFYSNIPIPAGE